jgi:N(2)-fixation sustaining protein CowN
MSEEVQDRYVSFMNIDCYKHASEVIDCVIEATKDERYNNPFWDAFKAKIPQAYYDKAPNEKVLYLVCASVFYLEELFEESAHARGLEIMQKCEYDCC